MAFCQYCGTELSNGTVFCPNCGQAVNGAASPNKLVLTKPRKSRKKVIGTIISVLTAVAVISVAIVIISKGLSDDYEKVAEGYAEAGIQNDYSAVSEYTIFDLTELTEYEYQKIVDECLATGEDEDELWEEISDEYGYEIKSVSDWVSAMVNDSKIDSEVFKEYYGENYVMTVAAISSADADLSDVTDAINDFNDAAKDYFNTFTIDVDFSFATMVNINEIKSPKRVTVAVSIAGDLSSDESEVSILVVKYKGEWKVIPENIYG